MRRLVEETEREAQLNRSGRFGVLGGATRNVNFKGPSGRCDKLRQHGRSVASSGVAWTAWASGRSSGGHWPCRHQSRVAVFLQPYTDLLLPGLLRRRRRTWVRLVAHPILRRRARTVALARADIIRGRRGDGGGAHHRPTTRQGRRSPGHIRARHVGAEIIYIAPYR